jgi:hypothetical protein
MHRAQPNPINERPESRAPTLAEAMGAAEQELAAFVSAVRELYGSEQARLSVEDWLEELALSDGLHRSTIHDWRLITLAASARLASRVTFSPASSNVNRET